MTGMEDIVAQHSFKAGMMLAILTFGAVIGIGMAAGDRAAANQCAEQCYAQEAACRKVKAEGACDAEAAKCLAACRKQ